MSQSKKPQEFSPIKGLSPKEFHTLATASAPKSIAIAPRSDWENSAVHRINAHHSRNIGQILAVVGRHVDSLIDSPTEKLQLYSFQPQLSHNIVQLQFQVQNRLKPENTRLLSLSVDLAHKEVIDVQEANRRLGYDPLTPGKVLGRYDLEAHPLGS